MRTHIYKYENKYCRRRRTEANSEAQASGSLKRCLVYSASDVSVRHAHTLWFDFVTLVNKIFLFLRAVFKYDMLYLQLSSHTTPLAHLLCVHEGRALR
jgi:hypothetical protein